MTTPAAAYYALSDSNKKAFNVAAVRLLRQVIMADGIVDENELEYFETFCKSPKHAKHLLSDLDSPCFRFKITPDQIQDSQSITVAKALAELQRLRHIEIQHFGSVQALYDYYNDPAVPPTKKIYLTCNIAAALRATSRCDGACDLSEARLCVILDYVLDNDDVFTFSDHNKKFRFAKNELIHFDTDPNPQPDRHIETRMQMYGFRYVSFQATKQRLANPTTITPSLLQFVYPTIFADIQSSEKASDENHKMQNKRVEMVRRSVETVSTAAFCRDVFNKNDFKNVQLPFVVLKIGKSYVTENVRGVFASKKCDDFICIPLHETIRSFCNNFTDRLLQMSRNIDTHYHYSIDAPDTIRGFHKTLLDYAIYASTRNITNIVIDIKDRSMSFNGVIPSVKFGARELASYLFIAYKSYNSTGLDPEQVEKSPELQEVFLKLAFAFSLKTQSFDKERKYLVGNMRKTLASQPLVHKKEDILPVEHRVVNPGNNSVAENYYLPKDTLRKISVVREGYSGMVAYDMDHFDDFLKAIQTHASSL